MEGVEIPPAEAALRDWMTAFLGQSVQLEKANARTADTIHIVERCEALVNEARD